MAREGPQRHRNQNKQVSLQFVLNIYEIQKLYECNLRSCVYRSVELAVNIIAITFPGVKVGNKKI